MNAKQTPATPVFMFTDLPKEEDQIANFCGDGESDSLSMDLSDIGSMGSIYGEQFFGANDDTYDIRAEIPYVAQCDDFDPIPITSAEITTPPANDYRNVVDAEVPYVAQCDDFDPIPITSAVITTPPARKYTSQNFFNTNPDTSSPPFIHENCNYGTYTPTTQVHFIPESTPSPEFIRLDSFEAAIAYSKKTHEDLLQWDRSNGVKKGFSRTMSKTNSSRVLVQSALESRKRSFRSHFNVNQHSQRRRTMWA